MATIFTAGAGASQELELLSGLSLEWQSPEPLGHLPWLCPGH